jgi:AcrR family transcriptional regulator
VSTIDEQPMPQSSSPAARATRLPRSARRAQLLDAARQVFVESGYHSAGMDEIADRAGVSKPVLYQHFPGKMELYLALLDDANERIVDAVLSALDSTRDNAARVEATMQAYFAFVAASGSEYRLVFESDLTNDPGVRDRVEQVEKQTAAAVARLLREGAGMDEPTSMLLATGVVGMAQTSARFWLAQGQPIPQDEAARVVATLVWRGIGVFPRSDTTER